jgi:4-carboxymuconolactone decarboxylase
VADGARRMLEAFLGKTFNPEGLDAKTRLLVTLGAGDPGRAGRGSDPLTVRHALEAGATPQEVAETIGRWPRCSVACPR